MISAAHLHNQLPQPIRRCIRPQSDLNPWFDLATVLICERSSQANQGSTCTQGHVQTSNEIEMRTALGLLDLPEQIPTDYYQLPEHAQRIARRQPPLPQLGPERSQRR